MSIKSIPHPQPQHLETSPLILLEVSHSVVLVGNSSDLMHRIRALHALICLSAFAGPCPKAGQSQTYSRDLLPSVRIIGTCCHSNRCCQGLRDKSNGS